MVIQELTTVAIKEENLQKIKEVMDLPLDFSKIYKSLRTDMTSRPMGYSIDPRNGNLIIYCPSRRKRPKNREGNGLCGVCEKEIPPVFLSKKLPSGNYAFVSENPFSFLNPDMAVDHFFQESDGLGGINFLLWPTTEHKEIHEISYEDHAVSFDIMAEMETMIRESGNYPVVQIVKNTSSTHCLKPMHGPYHIIGLKLYTDEEKQEVIWRKPKNAHEDVKFIRKRGISYPEYVKNFYNENFPGLVIKDYGEAVIAIHPHMRRPLEAIIYPKSNDVVDFSQLSKDQRFCFAKATSDISYALSLLMPAMNIVQDFCFVSHNNGGVFYEEVFPASQNPGGFERQREYICDSSPAHSGDIYKEFFKKYIKDSTPPHEPISKKIISEIRSTIIDPIDEKYS